MFDDVSGRKIFYPVSQTGIWHAQPLTPFEARTVSDKSLFISETFPTVHVTRVPHISFGELRQSQAGWGKLIRGVTAAQVDRNPQRDTCK